MKDQPLNRVLQLSHVAGPGATFEQIRYPDEILSKGMRTAISFKKPESVVGGTPVKRPQPVYQLVVDEMEELARVIFDKASVKPSFFMTSLNTEATSYLRKDNAARFP